MRAIRAKSSHGVTNRGNILLLDDAPQLRAARADHLVRRGFEVNLASTVSQAESLWQPGHYLLVLVAITNNPQRGVELCQRIKGEHPRQIVGLLVPNSSDFPPTRCPDLMWHEEGLDYFLARVETLADCARAA